MNKLMVNVDGYCFFRVVSNQYNIYVNDSITLIHHIHNFM